MQLLLDTHAFVWAVTQPERLGQDAAELIGDMETGVFVSIVSAIEIALKPELNGRFGAIDLAVILDDFDFEFLPLSLAHTRMLAGLPRHHRDPFDRLLVCQSAIEELALVTKDRILSRYGITTIW